MLLAVDIGNTNIVLGLYAGDLLLQSWRIATQPWRMPDEYAVLFTGLFTAAQRPKRDVEGAIVCSVVPRAQEAILASIQSTWQINALVVSPALDTGLHVSYDPPQAVGPDRIANAVAAVDRYGAPSVVVDFGTATTIDAIDNRCRYIGGAIAPGIEIAAEALFSRTARLHSVPLRAPATAIGHDTVSSLQSGIMYGYAGLVDGLVRRFQGELAHDAQVIATGGLAPIVAPHTETLREVAPDLTLHGLRLLYDRNTRARQS